MSAHLTLVADNTTEPATPQTPSEALNEWVPPPQQPHRRFFDRLRGELGGSLHMVGGAHTGADDLDSHRLRASDRRTNRLGMTDRGAGTAEYAVVILAAVAFAGLLVAIMRSGEVRQMLVDLVQNALGSAG